MKLSKKTEQILNFLREWQSEEHLYNLQLVYGAEIYDELEVVPFLTWWDVDLNQYFKDSFLTFANDGGGECTAFWEYEELQGEQPIIRYPACTDEPLYLAASLNDWVCYMIYNMNFYEDFPDNSPSDEELEELQDWYDKELDSLEDVRNLLKKERAEFKERALKVINFISEEEIEENMKKHPNFLNRYKAYAMKSFEIYMDKEVKDSDSFVTLLKALQKVQHSLIAFSKDEIIIGLKENYPEYCETEIFREWIKELDKPKPELSKEEQANAILLAQHINEYINEMLDEKSEKKLSISESFKEKYPRKFKEDFFKKRLDAIEKSNFEEFSKSDTSIKDIFTKMVETIKLDL